MTQTQEQHVQDEGQLAGCREIQRLLSESGVATALYRVDPNGGGAVCLHSESAENACELWEQCRRGQALEHLEQGGDAGGSSGICSQGYPCVRVEVKRKRQTQGFLVCCLKNLRYQKNESLERLCARLRVDTDTVIEQGLKGAIDAEGFSRLLERILPECIDKTQRSDDYRQEIEAVTQSLSQSYEEINLIHRITDGMKLTRSPKQFFGQLCQDVSLVVGAEQVVVLWLEGAVEATEPRVISSAGDGAIDENTVALLWHRTQRESQTTAGILLGGATTSDKQNWPSDIRTVVSVPIRRDQGVLGAVVAINKLDGREFDSIDTKLLISVANELAVYLENFRLYGDLQDLLIGSLRALTSSIDAKDPYTCGHSERVAVISHWIAEKMQLSADEVRMIYLAGLLHDVGKIGVSELVLRKPGRLLADEFEQIKQHPQIGSNILSGIRQMAEVSRAVLTHHERFDGKGYPMGLKGDQIPLSGRIVKLADSFDAMVSDRVYRRALPVSAALAEIRLYSGTQFDPVVAAVLLHNDLNDLMARLNRIDSSKPIYAKEPLAILSQ